MVCKRVLAVLMAGVLSLSAPVSVTASAMQPETELYGVAADENDLSDADSNDEEETGGSDGSASEGSSEAGKSGESSNIDSSEEDSSNGNSSSEGSSNEGSSNEGSPNEDASNEDASDEGAAEELTGEDELTEEITIEELPETESLTESEIFMQEYNELEELQISPSGSDFSRYSADEQAIVTSFTMSWSGHSTIDLMANNAAYYAGTMRVPVDLSDYDGKKPFHFEIGADNSSCVKSIDVIAAIAGTDYTIEATRKSGTNTFVAEGYFDEGNDCEYLTSIRIKLNSSKPVTIFNPDNKGYDYDPAVVERYSFFNERIPDLVTTKEVDGITEYTIDYGKLFSKTLKKQASGVIKFSAGKVSKTMEEATGLGIDVLKNSGYIVHGLDEDKYLFYEDKTQEDYQLLDLFSAAGEITGDAMKVKLAFDEEKSYSHGPEGYNFADDSLKEFSSYWDQSVKTVGLVKSISDHESERQDLYEEINNSTTISDKEEARKQADELYRNKCAYDIIKEVVIPMILASGGVELAAAGPAGLVFSGLLLAIDIASDWMWEARAAQIKGGSIGVSSAGGFNYSPASGLINMSSTELRKIKTNPNNPDSPYMWEDDWDFELYGDTNTGLTLFIEGNAIQDAEPYSLDLIPHISTLLSYVTTIIFSNNTYNNSIQFTYFANRSKCVNVRKVVFSPFARTIGGFQSFTGLKNVTIPQRVEEISSVAFYKSGIESVSFKGAESLKKIGEKAFSECPNLQGTIDIPGNNISIGNSAFYRSLKIRKIIIRGELECINANCFPFDYGSDKSQLKEIWFYGPIDNISSKVTNISKLLDKVYILGGIKNSEITFTEKPENTTRTSDYPFRAKEIFFSGSRTEWENLFPYHYLTSQYSNEKIHFGYKLDGTEDAAFSGNCGENVTYRIVDPGIKHDQQNGDTYDLYISGTGAMYDYATKEDVPWYGLNIRKIAISNGITRIGNYAFYGQKPYQETIDIPITVKEIGDYAFYSVDCDSTVLVVPDNVEKLGEYAFYSYHADSLYISRRLTEIPNGCFGWMPLSGSVVIPENVKVIGNEAFKCSSPGRNPAPVFDIRGVVEKIGDFAFVSYEWDEESQKPIFKNTDFIRNIKEIGLAAFRNSTISGNLEFSSELTSIDAYAFENCTGITGVRFGEGLTEIGQHAFKGCSNIEGNLILSSSLTDIGREAFSGCSGFTGDLIIPDSVKIIGDMAFKDCTGFKGKLVLPSPVDDTCNIASGVFDNCSGFTGELVIRLNKLSVLNNQLYRTFYGLTSLEKVTIKSAMYYSDRTLNGFVKSGEKGKFYELISEYYPGDEEMIEVSSFSPGTNICCDDDKVYKKFKDLGYKATLVDKDKGFTIRFDTGGHFNIQALTDQTKIPYSLPGLRGEGYTFDGWYLSPDFAEEHKAVPGAPITGDTTLYAKYYPNEYFVTFIPGNGTLPEGTKNPKKLVYWQPYGELPVPIPDNDEESFVGWYRDDTDGIKVKETQKVNIAKDHNLYARYMKMSPLSDPYITDASGNRYEDGAELRAGTRLYLRTAEASARIYYTTSEEEAAALQDADDHLYRTALLLTKDTTVYLRSYKDGYKNSRTVAYRFTVKDPANDWGDVIEADRSGIADATGLYAGLWVTGIEDRDYTGSAITFENLRVYYGNKLLTEGTDYTLKYSGNVKASTEKAKGTITVTCKGNYTGKKNFTFNIRPLVIGGDEGNSINLHVADVQAEATGKKIQLATTVTYDINGKETVLKKGTDFTYDYSAVLADPDEYTVKIVGKGNYAGTATFKELIYPKKEKINIAKLTFGKILAQTADGTHKRPSIQITDKVTDKKNPYELTDEDFDVEYFNDVLAGTATAVVTGKGNYGGTKTLTYKITGVPISKAKYVIGTVTYNGEAQKPSYTVTYQANKKSELQTLTEDVDFTVTASGNIKKGKGTLIFTGIGKYTGTVKKTFKIGVLGFTEGGVRFVSDQESSTEATGDLGSYVYTKGGVKPQFKLMYGEKELTPNIDYKVKYANNNAVGGTGKKTPSLAVTGAGNFSGTFTRTFTITEGSLENVVVTATDIKYSGKGGNIKPAITVYDTNGNKLVAGKDYDSKNIVYTYASEGDIFRMEKKSYYQKHVEVGNPVDTKTHVVMPGMVLRATVYGKGLYAASSENHADFTCVDNLLSKATVKLNKGTIYYTGERIEIDESDLSVKIGKQPVPVEAYRIESITGNIQKGTATVTIAGNGKCGEAYYGGTKSITFKINAKKIE